MPLAAACPRCALPVSEREGIWSCEEHGPVPPLWRPHEVSYDAFTAHLRLANGFATYLSWPLSPGWSITDFGVVSESTERVLATLMCCSGSSEPDGPVDLYVVAEEAGVGLGARCAGMPGHDPGPNVGEGPPITRVRVDSQSVPLWWVPAGPGTSEVDRSVLVGEAGGRWLWIIVHPASALLLLRGDWLLHDVSGVGAPLVDLPYGGRRPVL
ncbi:DUF6758 family protein [Nocardioides pacificus]